MKSLRMLPPFAEARGNLSGSQVLKYPTDNLGAYDAPMNKKSFARNYNTRYIGSLRAESGKYFFSVRTKNAVKPTNRSKQAMALLGGTAVVIHRIYLDAAKLAAIKAQYDKLVEYGMRKTWMNWLTDTIRPALISHNTTIPFTGPLPVVNVYNPWAEMVLPDDTALAAKVIKFWDQLTTGGYNFYVNSLQGIGLTGKDFQTIIDEDEINNLDLDHEVVQGVSYVKLGAQFLLDATNNYVRDTVTPSANQHFTLTDVSPGV